MVFKVILWGLTFFPLDLLDYLIFFFLQLKPTWGWNTQFSTLFSQPIWNKALFLQTKRIEVRILLQPIPIIIQMISTSISELEWNYYVPFSNRALFCYCSWPSSVTFWKTDPLHNCTKKWVSNQPTKQTNKKKKSSREENKYLEVKTVFIIHSEWIQYPEIFRQWGNII